MFISLVKSLSHTHVGDILVTCSGMYKDPLLAFGGLFPSVDDGAYILCLVFIFFK